MKNMQPEFRLAVPDDSRDCLIIRGQTRENAASAEHLAAIGVTEESWAEGVGNGSLVGYVCTESDSIVGYCFGRTASGEVIVLALLPTHEGDGIGRHLMDLVVKHFFDAGHRRLVLGCNPNPAVRSYGFYRHLGWTSTGNFDRAGDEILELLPSAANDLRPN
ncbi:MAG: ribosomal protein S18 acetylase RimI-like enzyme [Rhodothermales bacterium]